MLNGILLVDKPRGITSHRVVALARKALGTKKIGHAGTLDPMATGLVILGVGPSTRLLTYLVGLDKVYEATIRLGEATTTDDADGERSALSASDVTPLTGMRVQAGLDAFRGEIDQVPSTVSAIKVNGRRAYALARAGEDVQLASRRVTIHGIEMLATRADRTGDGHPVLDVDVTVHCSSGTYIRAIARDLGDSLGTGGHLTALRRTRIGPFAIADAVAVDGVRADRLLRPETVAEAILPHVRLDAGQADDLTHGRRVHMAPAGSDGTVGAFGPDGRLLGIAELSAGILSVRTNFPPAEEAP